MPSAQAGRKVTVTDGAWGTQLDGLGCPAGYCRERWNVERPELVRQASQGVLGTVYLLSETRDRWPEAYEVITRHVGCKDILSMTAVDSILTSWSRAFYHLGERRPAVGGHTVAARKTAWRPPACPGRALAPRLCRQGMSWVGCDRSQSR